MNKPILFSSGDKVTLGPLRKDLSETYQRWNNDIQTTRTLAVARPITFEEQLSSYDRITSSEKYIFFTIYENVNLHPIGITYLSDIDYKNRTAEFGIMIGEAEYRGKGYGTEVTQLVLDYAFTIAGLHNVFLKVYEYNELGFRAYKKAGFKECGRRRQSRFMAGKYWDEIFMECLSTEFKEFRLKKEMKFE
jgi:diamine N-acetyltransferase